MQVCGICMEYSLTFTYVYNSISVILLNKLIEKLIFIKPIYIDN
jgi:hypothetical protein